MANESRRDQPDRSDRPADDSRRADPPADTADGARASADARPGDGSADPNGTPAAGGDGSESGAGEGETRNWATQESYDEATAETAVCRLPDGGQDILHKVIPPMQYATLAEEHDALSVAQDIDNVSPEATVGDDTEESLAIVGFYQDIIVPNIIRPQNAHWNDPPTDPDAPEVLNLASLTENDLMTVLAVVIGEDPEEFRDDARARERAAGRGEPEVQDGRFRG